MIDTTAIVLEGPKEIACRSLVLEEPKPGDLVVAVSHSGISTGTERLFWSGEMPPFPGMGYPLVPGYEAVGEIVEAPSNSSFKTGERVFVPGAACFGDDVRGLFGGASQTLVTAPDRVARVDSTLKSEGALMALAATARHAIAGLQNTPPELIVGHGVLGRLLARLSVAAGGPPPTVWEINPGRMAGAEGYEVVTPDDDPRRDYRAIYDASGDASLLGSLISRLEKGGEVVLAGFYADPISFAFPPAFMKEARLRVAAEWNREDLDVTAELVRSGVLSLDGLITHELGVADASAAYQTAFNDSACLKMILNWGAMQ